jgi:hypothetical protein
MKTRDKSDRKSGEKMFEIAVPAPLEKYVAARKEIELGSITLLVYNVGTVTGSNKTVSANEKVNG